MKGDQGRLDLTIGASAGYIKGTGGGARSNASYAVQTIEYTNITTNLGAIFNMLNE